MSKSRVEREIEEILSKYDEEKGQASKTPRDSRSVVDFRQARPVPPRPRSYGNSGPSLPNLKRLSSGQYMLAAFGVAALAVVVGSIGIVGQGIATLLIILAVVLFLAPILLYRNTGTSSGGWSPTGEEKRWRGQVIDFKTRISRDDNDPLDGVKRFFRRR